MTQPAKGQEPSMEEILASIRRIIADEEPAKGTTEDTRESRQESLRPSRDSAALSPHSVPRLTISPPSRLSTSAAVAPALPKTDEEIDAMLAHLRGVPLQPEAATRESVPTEATAAPEPAPTLETQST